MSLVYFDGVLDAERFRAHALKCEYGPMVGPDDATYQGMSFDVPAWLGAHLYVVLRQLVGPIEPVTIFFRLSAAGTRPPHQFHTDGKIAGALGIVYLTLDEYAPPGAGTAVARHESGLDRHPETDEEFALWRRDHSDPRRWRVLELAPMKFGRLVLIPGDRIHAAFPRDGFGSTPADGRLVLVTFFNRSKTCDTSP